jgi:hypothetical protein
MKKRLASAAATLLAVAGVATAQQPAPAAPAAQPAPASKATGLAAWAMVVGNTLTAKIDGHDHAEYYMDDGTVKAMEGGSISKGKWALEGAKVCFTYPKEAKKCYTITVEGDDATFAGAEGTFRGALSKGNAKKL